VVARRASGTRCRVPASRRAAALMLVMPAIEPGCEPSLAGAATYTDAHAILVGSFLHLLVHRSATTVPARRRGLDAGALAFSRVPCEPCACEPGAHPRTPPPFLLGARPCLWPPQIDSRHRLVRPCTVTSVGMPAVCAHPRTSPLSRAVRLVSCSPCTAHARPCAARPSLRSPKTGARRRAFFFVHPGRERACAHSKSTLPAPVTPDRAAFHLLQA
jgi:hypothetical protein